jgi:cyclophilin family peptidyl-prolyl cis-trans isomerase
MRRPPARLHDLMSCLCLGLVLHCQGGDPNSKVGYGPDGTLEGSDKNLVRRWGTGGPGYNVPAEFNSRPHLKGVLSMARSADPNSAGSQFFVCLGTLPSLDNKYTVRLMPGAILL